MKHTPECEAANAAYEAQAKAFYEKHPNACRTCGGWGGHSSPGCSVPYGSTYVSLPDETDPCPDCQEKGLCPLCGSEMDVSEDKPCPACGWQWGDDSGLPEPPGCLCPDYPDEDFFK